MAQHTPPLHPRLVDPYPYIEDQPQQAEAGAMDEPYILRQLAIDPLNIYGGLPQDLREQSLRRLRDDIAQDTQNHNMRVTEGKDGQSYWAAEYPRAFMFDGQMRGDDAVMTHVIIETTDGEAVMIKEITGSRNPDEQKFAMLSTNRARKAAQKGQRVPETPLDSQALKDVVLVPGMPMQLGYDKMSGRALRTGMPIRRITGLSLKDASKLDPRDRNARPHTDARENFNNAMRTAMRQGEAGQALLSIIDSEEK